MDFQRHLESENVKPGVALIFNFVDFDIHKEKQLAKRTGSVHDLKKLKDVFYSMGVSVHFVNNPSLQEFNDKIEELSKYNFAVYSCMQLVFMSHGDEDNVLYCKDGEFNFLDKAVKLFENPTLKGKPKYIIVQACKGSFDTNWIYDNQSPTAYNGNEITAMLTSSFEGFKSYSSDTGSFFIKQFTKTLHEYWHKEPYMTVLEKVMTNCKLKEDQTATLTPFIIDSTFKIPITTSNNMCMPTEGEFIV